MELQRCTIPFFVCALLFCGFTIFLQHRKEDQGGDLKASALRCCCLNILPGLAQSPKLPWIGEIRKKLRTKIQNPPPRVGPRKYEKNAEKIRKWKFLGPFHIFSQPRQDRNVLVRTWILITGCAILSCELGLLFAAIWWILDEAIRYLLRSFLAS